MLHYSREKLEELIEKEADVQSFIGSYESKKQSLLLNKQEREDSILMAMDRLNRLEAVLSQRTERSLEVRQN